MLSLTELKKVVEDCKPKKAYSIFPDFKRVDVPGDGYCGYYVLQLVRYFLTREIITVQSMREMLEDVLGKTDPHYLEVQEMGYITRNWGVNIGVIVQSKRLGNKRKRARYDYPVYTVVKNGNQPWVFIISSCMGSHYELLTKFCTETKKYSAFFTEQEAHTIYTKICGVDAPPSVVADAPPICLGDQLSLLDKSDFRYISRHHTEKADEQSDDDVVVLKHIRTHSSLIV
jgi:hypothetical protein